MLQLFADKFGTLITGRFTRGGLLKDVPLLSFGLIYCKDAIYVGLKKSSFTILLEVEHCYTRNEFNYSRTSPCGKFPMYCQNSHTFPLKNRFRIGQREVPLTFLLNDQSLEL